MILDSRGYPTIEVETLLEDGSRGRASVPSGASTGSHEALELRDGGDSFEGKGVQKSLSILQEKILPKILEQDFTSQKQLDAFLILFDGTKNKSYCGANTILAISLSFAKAAAVSKGQELFEYIRSEYIWTHDMSLPLPMINVLNGGKHATASTDVQEWMIIPVGATTYFAALEMGTKVFYCLRKIMATRGTSAVGDEGGFPLQNASSNRDALVLLSQAVHDAGLILGKDIAFGLDVAASELYVDGKYELSCEKKSLSSTELVEMLSSLAEEFPIVSIEDGLAEDDWTSWAELTKKLGSKIQLVGDDLFVTNTTYIQKGIDTKCANAVLIKPNQIGTLSETVEAIILAQSNGMNTIISHRSGETEDTSIAHIAVASGAGQIKTGSLSRSERLAKYNELLRISEKVTTFNNPFLR